MKKLLLLLLLSSAIGLNAQKQAGDEKKLVEFINANMIRNMKLLEEIVNINSGTMNKEGVRRTGDILAKEFQKIGFTIEWINLPDSLQRAGHLVAYRKGNKGKKLFLIGHLDTVFEPDMPPNPYKLLNDSTATGQGVVDMKGGDVMILAALQALDQYGLMKDATITVYLTGDEEKSGKPESVSRADFVSRAKQHDIALGFEAASGLNTVATARRGASQWELKVYGRQAHSSGIFNNNYGAIYEAARIVDSFRVALSNEKYLTFNPAFFVGGSEIQYDSAQITAKISSKTNIISPLAIVQGDLRFLTETQKQKAREAMKEIVTTNNLPATRAEISFSDGIPSMEPTPGNDALVKILNEISTTLGFGATIAGDPGSRGAGDISYVAKYLDCIDGLGASGRGSHAPGETINLKQFPQLTHRAAILIYRLIK